MRPKSVVSVRLDRDLKQWLALLAKNKGCSPSDVIRDVLERAKREGERHGGNQTDKTRGHIL